MLLWGRQNDAVGRQNVAVGRCGHLVLPTEKKSRRQIVWVKVVTLEIFCKFA